MLSDYRGLIGGQMPPKSMGNKSLSLCAMEAGRLTPALDWICTSELFLSCRNRGASRRRLGRGSGVARNQQPTTGAARWYMWNIAKSDRSYSTMGADPAACSETSPPSNNHAGTKLPAGPKKRHNRTESTFQLLMPSIDLRGGIIYLFNKI